MPVETHAAEECDYSWCVAHRQCTCPYSDMHPHRAALCRYAREEDDEPAPAA
jgi:hypothetical protein